MVAQNASADSADALCLTAELLIAIGNLPSTHLYQSTDVRAQVVEAMCGLQIFPWHD